MNVDSKACQGPSGHQATLANQETRVIQGRMDCLVYLDGQVTEVHLAVLDQRVPLVSLAYRVSVGHRDHPENLGLGERVVNVVTTVLTELQVHQDKMALLDPRA